MSFKINQICVFFLLFLPRSGFAVTPDEVNKFLSNNHTPVLTLVGIKPFSEGVITPGFKGLTPERAKEIQLQSKLLDDARKEGVLSNKEITTFVHKTWGAHPDVDGEFNYTISWVNRTAAERLLRDQDFITVMHRNHLAIPQHVDDLIALYREAVEAGGYSFEGPRWANIVIGMCLGFPPQEVEIYAQEALKVEKSQRARKIIRLAGSNFSGYARFTNEGLERDEYYLNASKKTLINYKNAKAQGISDLDIFNHPNKIMSDLPMFPEKFLLRNQTSKNCLHVLDEIFH